MRRGMSRSKFAKSEATQKYINLLGSYIAGLSNRPGVTYRFYVIEDDALQALSIPGGLLFITTGLLKAVNEEDEVAWILGHEIAHVTQYHGIKDLVRNKRREEELGAFNELDNLDGEKGEKEKELDEIAAKNYRFSLFFRNRGDEKESDRLGTDFIIRAGYRPEAALSALRILQKHYGDGPANVDTRTHPKFSERIRNLEAYLKKTGKLKRKMVRTDTRFKEFQSSLP